MKPLDPRKKEKITPPSPPDIEREYPHDEPLPEFIGDKADWSEDKSRIKRDNPQPPQHRMYG